MDGGTSIMAELSRGQILKDPEVLGTSTSGAKIRLQDGDESAYIDLKVPDTVGTAYTFTLPADDGTPDQVLKTDGSGATSWTSISLSPAGSDTYIQFNDGGAFGGDVDLTWNKTTNLLDISGNLQLKATGEIRFADTDSSNYVAFKSPGTVAANRTYTLPAVIGAAGQVLKVATAGRTDTAATLEWANDETGAGGSSASGGTGDVQISDGAGVFTSDTDLNFDTTNTRLNIGDKTDATGNLFVEGTGFEPVRFKITENSATFGPNIGLYRESASPAGSDGLGYIYYYGASNIVTPPSTNQGYTYSVAGVSIVDPDRDSTVSGSYGPFGKYNLYLATRDSGATTLSRTVDYSPSQHRHVINWPTTQTYSGYQFEVTTSQGGGTNNITPNIASALCSFFYQGNVRFQLDTNGLLTTFGYDISDSDLSNFIGIRAPASVTSNYNITLPAAGGAANDVLQFDASQNASFVSNTRTLNFVIDGGGSAITTGIKGHIVLDGDYTVTGWTIIADQSGSIVVDVNRATYANFPTTASIAGTELPTLSSAQKAEDLTLSSWTTTLSARDVLEFQVDSVSTVTRVTVALRLVPR
jgi:hypothetical protein